MLESMRLVCELLSPEGDGSIPMELFFEVYEYLAKVDGTISVKTMQAVRDYLDPLAYVDHHIIVTSSIAVSWLLGSDSGAVSLALASLNQATSN